jgi:hypothetical protein
MARPRIDDIIQRLRPLPVTARRLFCVILRQTRRGSVISKNPGTATMPELHESCGLDVEQIYPLLFSLRDAGLIEITGDYPFEELRPVAVDADLDQLEEVFVDA